MKQEEAQQIYNDMVHTLKRIMNKVVPELESDSKHSLQEFSQLVDVYKDVICGMEKAQKFICMFSESSADIERKY